VKGKLTVFALAAALLAGCVDGKGATPVAQAQAAPAPHTAQPAAAAPEEEFEMGNAAPPEAPAEDVVLDESEVPVSLSFERGPGALGQPLTYVIVQAAADSVVVKSVNLNRGNCSAVPPAQSNIELPKTLKFGQSMRLVVFGCESVREVSIDTDTGEHTFDVRI